MSLDSAEPTSSRRALFGTAGAAGVAAAIAALSTARPVAAAPPFSPTAADTALLRQAMELELAARDLYETTLAAGISDDVTELPFALFGADGYGPSIYVKDPDGNTVELKGPPIENQDEPGL